MDQEVLRINQNKQTMNIATEIDKLSSILGNGTFIYKGVTYNLDKEATNEDKANQHLEGRPLKKLTGEDIAGNRIRVWSHDCESVTLPIPDFDEPTNTLDTSVPKPKPKRKTTAKKKPAAKK